MTLAAVLVLLTIVVLAARYRPEWFGDAPPAPPARPPTLAIDTIGRAYGASVLVNGHELNDVVADIDVYLRPGDVPRVTLHTVLQDGIALRLERADIHVPTVAGIEASIIVTDAARLIEYDRAGRHDDMELVAKLRELAAELRR